MLKLLESSIQHPAHPADCAHQDRELVHADMLALRAELSLVGILQLHQQHKSISSMGALRRRRCTSSLTGALTWQRMQLPTSCSMLTTAPKACSLRIKVFKPLA